MSVIEDAVHDGAGAVSKAFSIESARAGEAGRGFSVVASEIKALADRSSALTHEIGSVVLSTQAKIEELQRA